MNSKSNLNKLGVKKSHRDSLVKNLVSDLIIYEHIKTTRAKAKATTPVFDKAVRIAKMDLSKRELERKLSILVGNKLAVDKLIEVLAVRFKDATSGLVDMYALQRRKGDAAEQMQLMVKGYTHREIGKKTAEKAVKATKDVKAEDKEADVKNAKTKVSVASSKSQVAGNVSKAKVKSRSGI
jgi:large subunit ribosomal protein L17